MVDVRGYLRRLGIDDPGPPTAAALTMIHRAQVERIAYNTIDIHLGHSPGVDPDESADRIVATGRGGYCFHLNGALAALLSALGYDVRRHRGGVWRDQSDAPLEPFPNHLALTVHGLATDDAPGGAWFIDAGLGDALHEPMPLRAGAVAQGPFAYRLEPSPALVGGWRFRHDPAGGFTGMDFSPAPAGPEVFVDPHATLSTAADSPFVRTVSAQRRDADGVDKLISCTLTRIEGEKSTARELAGAQEWFDALAGVFGLTLDDVDEAGKARLWRHARAGQREWRKAQDAGA